MATEFVPSEHSTVRRHPERAHYDAESVHAVLDAGSVGHLAFVRGDRPVVIPMLYGREGDSVFLHGSIASRLMRGLGAGIPVSLAVTHLDALVMARSAFHHSMNYRSVVAFGVAVTLEGDDKVHGLRVITEHLTPGRWDEVREPSEIELRQTTVLRLDIEEASAKVRSHGVVDEDDDLDLDVWAGLVPVVSSFGVPVADPVLADSMPLSPSIARLISQA